MKQIVITLIICISILCFTYMSYNFIQYIDEQYKIEKELEFNWFEEHGYIRVETWYGYNWKHIKEWEGEKMSGGSLDYAEDKISSIIDDLERYPDSHPELLPLIKHLKRLGEVLHDIEWHLSCDTSMTSDEMIESIKSVTQPQDVEDSVKDTLSKIEKCKKVFNAYLN